MDGRFVGIWWKHGGVDAGYLPKAATKSLPTRSVSAAPCRHLDADHDYSVDQCRRTWLDDVLTIVAGQSPLTTEEPMGRLIKQGCKGEDVRAVQDVLNFHI